MPKANPVRKIQRPAIWFLKYLFRKLGIHLTEMDLRVIRALGPANYKSTISLLSKTRSQLLQDLFVISETKHKIKNKGGDISLNLVRQMESIFLIPISSKQNFLGQAYSLNRPDCGRSN